jgi:filamentous hemagglutinin
MASVTGSLHPAGRARVLVAVIAAIIGVAVWAPSQAHASGCENSWTNSKGGSWLTAENWSKKSVPTSSEEVCITENGTYTVELNGAGATVKALTIGGSSGSQTLSVGSTCSFNAVLTTSGLTIGAQGALSLTNADGCANNVTLSGPVTNSGTITAVKAIGGQRNLQGNLTNKGTLAINGTTPAFSGTKSLLTNEGAINLAEGAQLTVSSSNSVTNGTGGKIVGTGTGDLFMGAGTTFTQGAGTTSGTQPVFVDDGTLTYTGSGASLIKLRGTDTLGGNVSTGQSLVLESTCSENQLTTAGASFANAGSLSLTNGDGCASNLTLALAEGTLTNTGTITTVPAIGGQRNLQGNLTNKGTLAINANSAYNAKGAALLNEGAINLAEGVQLSVSSEGTVTNAAGGKILGTGSGNLFMGSGTTFTQGAGTTSGTQPVFVDDGTLAYSGSGASLIRLRGTDTLSGNISSGQSLVLESTCSENLSTTAGASFANAGSITLTNGDGCADNVTLRISAGTLTNTGTITTEFVHGGQRNLLGNITNKGTIALNAGTAYAAASSTLINEGAINIANEVALSVSGGAGVTNEAGTIAAAGTGVLSELNGTFKEGGGASTGSQPIVVDDATLSYTGNGSSAIALRGADTLNGPINAGQALTIQSTCSENASVAAAAFVNAGTITLTNGDGCGDNVTLNLGGATLENKGTISAEEPHGGARTIEGSILSEHTVALGAGATLKVTGSYTQKGKKSIFKTTIASGSAFGALSASGAASITGELLIVQVKPFTPTEGEKFGILGTSSLTGTFTKVKGNKIKKAKVKTYVPVYSATAVTLEAK